MRSRHSVLVQSSQTYSFVCYSTPSQSDLAIITFLGFFHQSDCKIVYSRVTFCLDMAIVVVPGPKTGFPVCRPRLCGYWSNTDMSEAVDKGEKGPSRSEEINYSTLLLSVMFFLLLSVFTFLLDQICQSGSLPILRTISHPCPVLASEAAKVTELDTSCFSYYTQVRLPWR